MNGLKNLFPRNVFVQSNYSLMKKGAQNCIKNLNSFLTYIWNIDRIYQDYYDLTQTQLVRIQQTIKQHPKNSIQVHVIKVFIAVTNQLRTFNQKLLVNQQPLNQINSLYMQDFCFLIQQLQKRCRNYATYEQILVDNCNKYYKTYKNMLALVQIYKNSFMDVRVIYNADQKVKRYNECVKTYKMLQGGVKSIDEQVGVANVLKEEIKINYTKLIIQLQHLCISFATKYLDQLRQFSMKLVDLQKNQLKMIIGMTCTSQNFKNNHFFWQQEDMLVGANGNNIQGRSCIPGFLLCQFMSQSYVNNYKTHLFRYLTKTTRKLNYKQNINTQMIFFMMNYLLGLQNNQIEAFQNNIQAFEKIRKPLQDVFGPRWISFYMVIKTSFQQNIQNLCKYRVNLAKILTQLQQAVTNQNAYLTNFAENLKKIVQNIVSKNSFKKYLNGQDYQSSLQKQQQLTRQQIKKFNGILIQKITETSTVQLVNQKTICQLYLSVLQTLQTYTANIYNQSQEIQGTFYAQTAFNQNYKLCIQQYQQLVKKQITFLQENKVYQVLQSDQKITFQSEFNKIQGFKKLKKPKELQENIMASSASIADDEINRRDTYLHEGQNDNYAQVKAEMCLVEAAEYFKGKQNSKYAKFLLKRIVLVEKQRFIKSASCALSDRFLLAGRLFITSDRICFHSKFNSKTIVCGSTFIQIPRKDILKIQKRQSSLFVNNAISISTVNGEMLFASFFGRDAIFEIIQNTFEINSQQIFFQEQQDNSQQQTQPQSFEDDMKLQTSLLRVQRLTSMLSKFQYKPIFQTQFEYAGLTTLNLLRWFELNQPVQINRTQFASFTYYMKDFQENKEIDIQPWTPAPIQSLNSLSIKQNIPDNFSRKLFTIVPLPASPIPFMPKVAPTTQNQVLYIISNTKYIIESTVQTADVPYANTFDLKLRKTVQLVRQNVIKMSVQAYFNFNQSVMIRSTIQTKTIEGTLEGLNKVTAEMRKYLTNLYKKSVKNPKKESAQDKINQQNQTIKELSLQLKAFQEENKALKKQMEQIKGKMKTREIGLGVSLGLLLIVIGWVAVAFL